MKDFAILDGTYLGEILQSHNIEEIAVFEGFLGRTKNIKVRYCESGATDYMEVIDYQKPCGCGFDKRTCNGVGCISMDDLLDRPELGQLVAGRKDELHDEFRESGVSEKYKPVYLAALAIALGKGGLTEASTIIDTDTGQSGVIRLEYRGEMVIMHLDTKNPARINFLGGLEYAAFLGATPEKIKFTSIDNPQNICRFSSTGNRIYHIRPATDAPAETNVFDEIWEDYSGFLETGKHVGMFPHSTIFTENVRGLALEGSYFEGINGGITAPASKLTKKDRGRVKSMPLFKMR